MKDFDITLYIVLCLSIIANAIFLTLVDNRLLKLEIHQPTVITNTIERIEYRTPQFTPGKMNLPWNGTVITNMDLMTEELTHQMMLNEKMRGNVYESK